MIDPEEQRRQRRAVAAVLAGVVVLGAAGIAASIALGGGPCEDLLPASYTAPPAVIDGAEVIAAVAPDADGPSVAAAVAEAGEALGLGPLRGATPGSADAVAVPVDDAVFVVADEDHVRIIDTGIVSVATGRDRPEQASLHPLGTETGLVQRDLTGDVLVARYDDDLSLTACRELRPPGVVVHLSRGIALVTRDSTVEAAALSGDTLWTAEGVPGTPAVDGATTGLLAVLASRDEVAGLDLRTGEVRWSVTAEELGDELAEDPILLAGDDVVVVATGSSVVRLDGADGRVLATDTVAAPPLGAATTAGGIAIAAGDELLRFTQGEPAERIELPGRATGAPLALGEDVLVVTDGGMVRVAAGGGATVAADVPVGTSAVAGGYTLVGIDVGEGFLAFYGPARSESPGD